MFTGFYATVVKNAAAAFAAESVSGTTLQYGQNDCLIMAPTLSDQQGTYSVRMTGQRFTQPDLRHAPRLV